MLKKSLQELKKSIQPALQLNNYNFISYEKSLICQNPEKKNGHAYENISIEMNTLNKYLNMERWK